MKNKNNKYYLNNKERTNKPFSWEDKVLFIYSDVCYCGHKSKEHILDDDQCVNQEICRCVGFLP